jgi:hypothetical protein
VREFKNQLQEAPSPLRSPLKVNDMALNQAELKGLKPKNTNICFKILHALDLFAFEPVPKTNDFSTRRSILGSLLIIALFLTYVIFTFVNFFINNTPTLNTYSTHIMPNQNFTLPRITILFVTGTELNISFYDETYFKINLDQVISHQRGENKNEYQPISLTKCLANQTEWHNTSSYTFEYMLCPAKDLIMQGELYESEKFIYPRFTVVLCENKTTQKCADRDKINYLFQTGRIFLYIETKGKENFATGVSQTDSFQLLYYTLIPGDFLQNEIIIKATQAVTYPDYLTSFHQQVYNYLDVNREIFYFSRLKNQSIVSQVTMRIDSTIDVSEFRYMDIMMLVSKWGALFGVLFWLLGLYFAKKTQDKFYELKPDWDRFDDTYNNKFRSLKMSKSITDSQESK